MRVWWTALLLVFTTAVYGDPDLRQLLNVWHPTNLTWRHVTPECGQAMEVYTRALSHRQQWASLMLDATGQSEPQYLTGSNFWLGSRLQCEQVSVDYPDINGTSVHYPTAVYRVLKLKINVSEPLVAPQLIDQVEWYKERYIWMGVCVPGACGEISEVTALFQQMLETDELENKYRDVQLVKVKELPSTYSVWGETPTTLLILLCIVVIGLTILGSILDGYKTKTTNDDISTWKSMMLAFSLPRNIRSLCDTSTTNNITFPALHGIRVLTMAWIIVGHLCIYMYVFGENPSFKNSAEKSIFFQLLINAYVSVDTFFFITGLLLSYIFLNSENNSERKRDSFIQAVYKFLFLFLTRIIRLILPYIFTILLVTVTFRQLNADSIFDSEMPETVNCPHAAWTNLLFINNFYHGKQMCLTWTWYLATDTQIYLLAIVLLLIYVNGYPRIAVTFGSIILVLSWLMTAGFTYVVSLYPVLEQQEVIVQMVLGKPWMHVGAVWVGVVTGWMIHRGIAFKLSKVGITLGWICFALGLFIALIMDKYNDELGPVGTLTSITFRTTIWGVCIAWVLLLCVHKRAGLVSRLLELPIFYPLGRSTYCTYLLHLPLMEWIFLNLEAPQTISRGISMILALGFIYVSFVFGAFISVLFESPMIRLLSLLRTQKREKRKAIVLQPLQQVAATEDGASSVLI